MVDRCRADEALAVTCESIHETKHVKKCEVDAALTTIDGSKKDGGEEKQKLF